VQYERGWVGETTVANSGACNTNDVGVSFSKAMESPERTEIERYVELTKIRIPRGRGVSLGCYIENDGVPEGNCYQGATIIGKRGNKFDCDEYSAKYDCNNEANKGKENKKYCVKHCDSYSRAKYERTGCCKPEYSTTEKLAERLLGSRFDHERSSYYAPSYTSGQCPDPNLSNCCRGDLCKNGGVALGNSWDPSDYDKTK
jgi:hypothetical protein